MREWACTRRYQWTGLFTLKAVPAARFLFILPAFVGAEVHPTYKKFFLDEDAYGVALEDPDTKGRLKAIFHEFGQRQGVFVNPQDVSPSLRLEPRTSTQRQIYYSHVLAQLA